MTADIIGKNYSKAIKNCVAPENAHKFLSTVKDTPAYWWHMLSDVFAMVKQRDIPTYFMIVLIIEKLKGSGGESVIAGRDYDSRFKELNSNPVLLAYHF